MAKAKQFSITVQNEPGAVAHIARTLGDAKVNILALLATVQGSIGIAQITVDSPARAKKALDAGGIKYQETAAEEYELANTPGSLANHLEKLAAKGVNLTSIHATAGKGGKKAVVVCTAESAAAKAAAASAS
jgi:hypothetical protein